MSAILGMFIMLFACLLPLLGTAFWIWMLVDSIQNEPSQRDEKLIWILVIALTHFIGAAIYFFVRRPQRISMFGR